MRSLKPVITADGSSSIFVPQLNEHYHSTNGAIQESLHVFINSGLRTFFINNPMISEIRIFEMGFGTGLNALLAWQFSQENNIPIHYSSVEKYPINLDLVKELNYGQQINQPEAENCFRFLHSAAWDIENTMNNFTFIKINNDILQYCHTDTIHVVFFDAFSPDIEPQLWNIDVFKKITKTMDSNSILTTYSAKGEVRRNLMAAGFTVEKLEGPPGKRHMLRGIFNEP